MWGIDKRWKAGIMKIKRGAAGRREPPFTKRSNRAVGTVGRLLLFAVQEQVNDTNDQNADLNEIRIRDHDITPLLCSGGGKEKCGLLPKEGPPAYRLPRRCAPRNDGELGIDKRWKAGIMKIGGSPCLLTEVIVSWGTMGGYFFSIWIYLENQRNDADDQNTEVKEIRIRDHLHHPLM